MAMNSFHARQGKPKPARPEPARNPRSDLRADQRLVAAHLAASRSAAQKLIASGRVSWHGQGAIRPVGKAAEILPDGGELVVDPENI
jgi:23S rRNA (cytidine1920-2'-O)/16S rRNA (cytidine1409-2'-O)-methyltransferase